MWHVQPPAIRLLILGPRGAGKSLHGRTLAKKLGLFHIQFREYLQELVIAKTKKRVVSEREETQTAAEQDLPPEEPWVAVHQSRILEKENFLYWSTILKIRYSG